MVRCLILFYFFFLLLLSSSAHCAGLSHDDDNKVLRLAMTGGYRPFSTVDSKNNLVGFDADIAREIAIRMGYRPELVRVEWDGLQANLKSGKCDLVCASMAITEARLKNMYFSLPYYVSGAQIFAKNGLESIQGARIGVTQQTTYAAYIENHPEEFPDTEVFYFPDDAQVVAALNTNKIDAFVSDRIVGSFYIRQGQEKAGDIAPLGGLLYIEDCGIAARFDSVELVHGVNNALLEMVQDGTYESIYQRWVGEKPDLELLFSGWARQSNLLSHDDSSQQESADTTNFAESLQSMLPIMIEAARLTLILSALSALIAFFTGSLVGVGCVSPRLIIRRLSNGYIWLVRGTPLMVQLFIFYYIVATQINTILGTDVVAAFGAGIMALTVNMTAYNAETLRGAIQAVDRGQWDAAASLGMMRGRILRRVVLPQAYRDSLASFGNNIVVLIKDTSLVGVITLIELTFAARGISSQSGDAFMPYTLAALFYIVIISLISLLARGMEARLQRSR